MAAPIAYVRYVAPANALLIRPDGLVQATLHDIPGISGGGLASSVIPPLIESFGFGAVTLGSAAIGGYIVPDRHTDTDPLTRITPVTGRPGPSSPDSTAGLQAFVDSTPPNAKIILPFDLVVNGTLTLNGSRVFRTSDPVNNKKRLIRTLTFPWRVRPDQRATINGDPNPGYHPDMRCSRWQYDWRGGKAAENGSLQNPYGRKADGKARASGSPQGGFDSHDGTYLGGYDGKHLYALPDVTVGGTTYTGVPGAVWLGSDVNKVLTVLINAGMSGVYQNIITSVTNGGRTVGWANAVSIKQTANGTTGWCINYKGASWELYMVANPASKPVYFTDPTGWNAFKNAQSKMITKNQADGPVVQLNGTATLMGIEVVGPNNGPSASPQDQCPLRDDINPWTQAENWANTAPVINEVSHLVMGNSYQQTIDHCDIHHSWGDAVGINGAQVPTCRYTALHSTGRQGSVANCDNALFDHCEFGDHNHSALDIEASVQNPSHNVRVQDCTFYGDHGISWTSTVIGFWFINNHSTAADLAAATAGSWQKKAGLCAPARAIKWNTKVDIGMPRSSNVNITGNDFDAPTSNGESPYWFGGVDGVVVKNNKAVIGGANGYFFTPITGAAPICTNIQCSGNDGGAHMIGQMPPVQNPSSEIRFANGYTTGYTWWDNNPPGSAAISDPVIHAVAGGNGTYADPITVAVDFKGSTGTVHQFAPGTIFYIPNLRAYFIAEDTTVEYQSVNTAAHVDPTLGPSNPHLDLWSDGRTKTSGQADACVQSFTNTGILIIQNPQSNYAVIAGTLADGTCRTNHGNTVITV